MTKYERLAAVLTEAKKIMETEGIADFVRIDIGRQDEIEVLLKSGQTDADKFLTETKSGAYLENGKQKRYIDRFGKIGGVKFTATASA